MKKMIIGISFFAISSSVSAQQAFDGFNFQLGIGGTHNKVDATGTEDTEIVPNVSINGTSSATRLNGVASMGYSKSFDRVFKGFNLAANAFYVIGNQSGGSKSNSAVDVDYGNTETISGSYKLKNTWGISLEPGYYFKNELLGYLKLAYISSRAEVGATCYTSDSYCYGSSGSFDSLNSSTTFNKTLNGVGYGAGVKYLIQKDVYAALDFLYVDYSKINQSLSWTGSLSNASFKPQQLIGFMSIGYKF